jgi:hypothetical protein
MASFIPFWEEAEEEHYNQFSARWAVPVSALSLALAC